MRYMTMDKIQKILMMALLEIKENKI